MDSKKLYTLSLKFNRHNIQFEYDESSNYILIGRAQKVKRKIITAIVLLIIVGPLMIISPFLPFLIRKVFSLTLLFPIIYSVVSIFKSLKLARKNKLRKIITEKAIQLESTKGFDDYTRDMISDLKITLKKEHESLAGEASLEIVLNDGKKVHLLSLKGEKTSDLKLDLEYLKDFIVEFMNLSLKQETVKIP